MDIKQKSYIKFLNIEKNLLDEANIKNNAEICRALSSELRIKIVNLIAIEKQGLTISEIAKKLDISVSSATFHLKLLENSGIVNISFLPNKKGNVQICRLNVSSLYFFFSEKEHSANADLLVFSVPVGHYVDAKLDFISGFCTKNMQIMFDDNNYFMPERMEAEIIWCRSGFVEYAFSNTFKEKNIKEITFSLEVCSETLGYQNDWKSDITFSLNETELLTWTSPGDFGDRRGLLNPDWWSDTSTQYGHLKKISITSEGIYLDGSLLNSNIGLEHFDLTRCSKLLFKIENKENAKYKGGFNIFGKSFGDFPQDILLTVVFNNKI
jgi:predicted transcriptional regulator